MDLVMNCNMPTPFETTQGDVILHVGVPGSIPGQAMLGVSELFFPLKVLSKKV